MLDLLSELVSFKTVSKSGYDEKEEKRKCAIFLANYFKDLGLDVHVSHKTNPNNDVTSYNVVAKRNVSEKAKTAAFLGHFDVVPAREAEWDYDPYKLTIVDDKAYGRGSLDMKGGLAAGLRAIEKVVEREVPVNILVLLSSDEETGGEAGMGHLVNSLDINNAPDFAINGDGNGNRVINRRRNVFLLKMTSPRNFTEIRGMTAFCSYETVIFERENSHAAYFLPYVDTHALLKASQFLNSNDDIFLLNFDEKSFVKNNVLPSEVIFEFIVPDRKGTKRYVDLNLNKVIKSLIYLSRLPIPSDFSYYGVTITPNVVKTTKTGVEIDIDVRANLKSARVVEEAFQKFIDLQKLPVKLEVYGSPSPLETGENTSLVKTACEIQKQLVPDEDPGPYELGGASDSRFFTPLGVATIDYGVSGGNLHGSNEYVLLKSLDTARDFYTSLIEKMASNTS